MENVTMPTTGIVPTMPINSDGFGGNGFWWIIILFFFFFNRGNGEDIARESSMNTQFIERDLQGINNNLCSSTASLTNAINGVNTQVLDAKYASAIGNANLDKDILLGNANLNQTILLGNQTMASQMADCCCSIKGLIRDEVQGVKDLINNNTIQALRDELNLAQIASANSVQTSNILNSIGRFYTNPSVNPYTCYNTCGCNGTYTQI